MHVAPRRTRSSKTNSAIEAIVDALRRVGASLLNPFTADRFERRGRGWIVDREDTANGRLVCRIAKRWWQARASGQSPVQLVTFRRQFRRITKRGNIAGLFVFIDHEDAETIRLGIWLMGRTNSCAAIPEIARFADRQNVRIRREAARALRRLGGWAELRAMAHCDFDPRVIRLATSLPARPLDERLRRVTRSIHSAAKSTGDLRPAELFVELPVGPGRAPKPTSLIRAILERIRLAVRGY